MTGAPYESLTRRQAWALALVATFTMAVSYFDRQTLAVLAPEVTRALNLTETEYGWLASAFSIAYLVGAPLAGRWIDHIGARRGLLAAVIVWSIIAALHAIAPSFAVLFMLRIALGLAESPSFPGATQTIHRALPPDERPRAFGVLFTGSSFGAMLIPPVATYLLAHFGWRGAFLGTSVIGLVWVPVWIWVAYNAKARVVLDHGSGTASTTGLWRVLSHPAVMRAVILVLAASPTMAFVFLWQSKYIVHEFALEPTALGNYLWMPPVFLDLGSVIFGDLAARRRKKRPAGAPDRLLVALASLLTMSIVFMPYARGPWTAMFISGAAMAGGGGLFALLTGDMLARVPAGIVSRSGGMTAAAQSLAYIIASPLIGWSVDRTASYGTALLALGLSVIPGAIVWIVWVPKDRH